jgi:hypothetical protein
MKKLLTVFLALILVMSLVACDSNNDVDPTVNSTEDTIISTNTDETTANVDHEETQPSDTEGDEIGVTTEPTETVHEHNYAESVIKATCTSDGYTTYLCECEDTYNDNYTQATGHNWGDWETVTQPTESAEGTAKRTCANCDADETKSLPKVIPNHSHKYVDKITKSATCTAEGVKTFTCSCGDSYTESIAQLSHEYSDKVVSATCTEKGYTQHQCKKCSNNYKDTYVDAKGHKYTGAVTKNATCTQTGVKTFTCSNCGDSYTTTIQKTAHSYTTKEIKPTCTERGYTTYTCACGYSYTDKYVNAAGHKWGDWITTKDPTTSSTGTSERKCNNCSKIETKTLPKVESGHVHSWKDATCSAPKTCSTCGATTGNTIEHKWKDATCTTAKTCTSCGTTSGNALGHNYTDKVTAPTCTESGYTTHTCARCKNSYQDATTAAIGHAYKETSNTATCTSAGTKTETCSNCGHNKTSTSKATGHVNTKTDSKPADCATDGYKKTICTDCGAVISETTIPSNGSHNYVSRRMSDVANEKINSGNSLSFALYAKYVDFTDWNVDVCSQCGNCNIDTLRFAYSDREAASIMLGYVNELRASYYGSSNYALTLDSTLIELANIRAKEISSNYGHSNVADGECIVNSGCNIIDHYNMWYKSPTHKAIMVGRGCVKFGYGTYYRNPGSLYGVMLFNVD